MSPSLALRRRLTVSAEDGVRWCQHALKAEGMQVGFSSEDSLCEEAGSFVSRAFNLHLKKFKVKPQTAETSSVYLDRGFPEPSLSHCPAALRGGSALAVVRTRLVHKTDRGEHSFHGDQMHCFPPAFSHHLPWLCRKKCLGWHTCWMFFSTPPPPPPHHPMWTLLCWSSSLCSRWSGTH